MSCKRQRADALQADPGLKTESRFIELDIAELCESTVDPRPEPYLLMGFVPSLSEKPNEA